MLQSWQALKLQLGQNRPSRRVVRAAPCAASQSTWGRRGGRTSAPGLRLRARSPGRDPPHPQPCAFRGGAGTGNASAPAPGHRRGAAACGRARRGEGAAASARSKCSRSLRRFPRRSLERVGGLSPTLAR